MKNKADIALEKFKIKIPALYENEKDIGKLELVELLEPWKDFLYNILDHENIKNYLDFDMSSMTINLTNHFLSC